MQLDKLVSRVTGSLKASPKFKNVRRLDDYIYSNIIKFDYKYKNRLKPFVLVFKYGRSGPKVYIYQMSPLRPTKQDTFLEFNKENLVHSFHENSSLIGPQFISLVIETHFNKKGDIK